MSLLTDPMAMSRLLVTAFFAVVFLQSASDKLFDPDGNIAYFSDHFKDSPFPREMIPILFWALTLVESAAGILCVVGILIGDFARSGMNAAAWGVAMAGFALLCLMAGQRLAKDYAGAAVVAAYFVIAVIGVALF